MNERIKELIAEATTIEYGADNGFDRVTFDKEKFAGLIVKECMKVNSELLGHNTLTDLHGMYKDHFGELE